MGPESTTMSATDAIKLLKLPKLQDDGSNWITYRERIINTLTHKGLKRHVLGTARIPTETEIKSDKVYKKGGVIELTSTQIEEIEKETDDFEQKEASVREVIYETIGQSLFLQIKNETSAAKVWTKLVSIMEKKGDLIQVSILAKMQNKLCLEDDDVRAHLATMSELKEQLEGMGAPMSDQSFAAIIRKSLPASYRSLLQTLSATARVNEKILTSDQIIAAVHEEADEQKVHKEADKAAENAAMVAAHTKRHAVKCTNCKRTGHKREDCFMKGGGKEGQAPWDKKKDDQKDGKKEGKHTGKANVASTDDADNEDVSLAVTCCPTEPLEALATYPANCSAIIDCGATRHFTPNRSDLINFVTIEPKDIKAANGITLQATGRGDLKIIFPMGENNQPTRITLKDVYYSPDFAFTLISVGTIDRKGFSVNMEDGICTVRTPKPERRTIGHIPLSNGLYRVSIATNGPSGSDLALAASGQMSINELHRKMGHINHDDLRRMVKEGTITGVDLDTSSKPELCPGCIEGKAPRRPFPKLSTSNRAKKYGDKVVSDLWGPTETESLKGKKYYILFQDEYTHEQRIYFLHKKSEAFEAYKLYEAWVKMQRDAGIRILGTDRGGEFTGAIFKAHLEKAGTVRHLTVHDSPQSNGKAERANRTIGEGIRALLASSGLPESLWAEAAAHHVWLRNRVPTKALPVLQTCDFFVTFRHALFVPLFILCLLSLYSLFTFVYSRSRALRTSSFSHVYYHFTCYLPFITCIRYFTC